MAVARLGSHADAKTVTIVTDATRRDVDGNYIDAFDGKIVYHNGVYYLYVVLRGVTACKDLYQLLLSHSVK